ncbi:MAG: hypothetical protein WCP55_10090 [Lentisphaerota bacterium]
MIKKYPNDNEAIEVYNERYYNAVQGLWNRQIELINRSFAKTLFLGECMPCFSPDFGPDQYAAFFGAKLKFSEDSKSTNWADPIIEDWEKSLPLVFDDKNPTYQQLLEYTCKLAEDSRCKYLVGHIDKHSNADTLSALRGSERFCMDLYDFPEGIGKAMQDVRKAYKKIWDDIYKAGNMGGERGCCHYGIWHEKCFSVVQCDAICMIGKEHFREYVLPAIEEEVSYSEATYFHLDGTGALRHLDDILSIKNLGILQWQPGDGQKANFLWLDVLKKAQSAGKSVIVFGNAERKLDFESLKPIYKELDPAKAIYCLSVQTIEEYETIIKWMKANT